ncbi:MAG: pdeM [Bacteroidetes bacterium]|jgi:DNA ligase-associated metallophosphoesterase|nr:pdeM [Bacteroidota bacterium]MDF2453594.1 pdeM [Bacteroidota bacterium]
MKKPYEEIKLRGESFFLLPQRAMYRPSRKQLIISDIHLGKAAHFRKQGIAFPAQSHLKDIDKLNFLLAAWQPHSVLILGDLFHSSYNKEWLWFKSLLMEYEPVQFILIEGNHDILDQTLYSLPNLLKVKVLEEDHFIFSHHPLAKSDKLNICGHVHPGLQLFGTAKQSIRLPCFYLGKVHFILPAFGNLTGLHILEREDNADYYLIVEDKVVKL